MATFMVPSREQRVDGMDGRKRERKNKNLVINSIYTLGTSNRSIEEFFDILRFYQIQAVIDVRHWPTSKWFPHFKKENLILSCRDKEIDYYHYEKLGGFRKGGYEIYMESMEFKEGLKDLIKIAEKKITVIICAERLPWKCHRMLISRKLEDEKFEILHIIEKNHIWEPRKEPHEIKPLCQKKPIPCPANGGEGS